MAIVKATIGQENFKERDAAAIGCIGMTNSSTAGGADAFPGG